MSARAPVPQDLDRDSDLEQRAWTEDEKQEILRCARNNVAQGDADKQEIMRRDSDLEQRAWTEDEKQEILRCARNNVAQGDADKQEIMRRDSDLEQRAWTEDEKQEILRCARNNVAQGDADKQEIMRRDSDLEQRAWTEDEKQEILRCARNNVAQGDADKQEIMRRDSDLDEKRTRSDAEKREILRRVRENIARPDATKRRQSEGSADDVADFDPVRRTAWPQLEPPMEPRTLDASLDDLVAARVETAFAGQHEYILEVMATALAESVLKERRRYERQIGKLKHEVESLKGDHTAADLQQFGQKLEVTLAKASELVERLDRGPLDLPSPLSARRSSSVN